jgi:hypothetical protein
MSYRRMTYVPLLLLLVTMMGCATFSPAGDGSHEEMKTAAMSKEDLWNQTKELEKEKAAYQKQLADQQEEIARMAKGLSEQQAEIAQANKHAGELNKSVEELNAQVRLLQEARQKEHPLIETELVQPKKEAAKPIKKIKSPKKVVRKVSPAAKEKEAKAGDTSGILKQITEARQKLGAGKEESEKSQRRKETPRENIAETQPEAQPETAAAKAREPKPLDDLSLRMKQFGEAEPGEGSAKETGPAQAKKETAAKEGKKVKTPKQTAIKEPAETQPPKQKAPKIKVLAGDGNIASARSLSKRLAKMGYRVKLIDKAPRSDFDATVVYYGTDHRATAETMAKRLGSGAATRPLTWPSDFDIIVVTGRQP